MNTYNYITGNGFTYTTTDTFMWQSLCHNEEVMDNHSMMKEPEGFGWGVCRRCGKPSHFIKRWPK